MRTILLGLMVLASGILSAQSDDKKLVMKPIEDLFNAMRKGDSAMAHRVFRNDAVLMRASKDKAGAPTLHTNQLAGFLKAVGTQHKEIWSEEVWNVDVRIDGNLAQVWADYAFYLDKKFSHCGIDAFHLARQADGTWKIFKLADTKRVEDCVVPQSTSDKFK